MHRNDPLERLTLLVWRESHRLNLGLRAITLQRARQIDRYDRYLWIAGTQQETLLVLHSATHLNLWASAVDLFNGGDLIVLDRVDLDSCFFLSDRVDQAVLVVCTVAK